ncbi:MAG: hypothetical protein KKH83_08780, partial [Candidatus Margulisbacteria bacterium]|nr:hypothetical protein [Candidatus Margulisiibacteriota bacterium]
PNMMKQFEYSFNFAAWKPIESVNPETGEFVLEDMPFAEGQNIIAIRSTNAADVKNHQHMKIILNTIPLLSTDYQPIPNSYTKNKQPLFSMTFAKAAYSASVLEEINLVSAALINESKGEERDITKEIVLDPSGGDYDKRLKVSWQSLLPLEDGRYVFRVVVNSNVGTAQAFLPVTIDTTPPTITITGSN